MKMNNDTLTHHGVKGMHWGVRRYQNADGSLTSKGKERYGDTKSGSASKPQATHRPKPVADGVVMKSICPIGMVSTAANMGYRRIKESGFIDSLTNV